MAGIRLTKRIIDGLDVTGADYVAWDSDLPGFGVRVRASGAKSYIVFYRAGSGRNAPKRKLTIGAVGKLTPNEARTLARKAIGQVANGSGPAAIKTGDRKALTVSELVDLFLSDHVEAKRKPGTAGHYRDILKRIVLPDLGTMKADTVSLFRYRSHSFKVEKDSLSGQPRSCRHGQHVFLCSQKEIYTKRL